MYRKETLVVKAIKGYRGIYRDRGMGKEGGGGRKKEKKKKGKKREKKEN